MEKVREFPSSLLAEIFPLCAVAMAWTTVTSLYIEDKTGTLNKLKTFVSFAVLQDNIFFTLNLH
jgi:mannitol-specific phosphotransferase system IIBC component